MGMQTGKIHVKAMAKINLGLDVLRRLENGYHEVRMIMQTVNLYDELIFTTAKEEGIHIYTENAEIPTDESNLIYRAAALLMKKHPVSGGVVVELRKNIPVAAGMAGGSTDAAAAFVGINALYDMNFSKEELREMAVGVGADVPYCIMGGTVLAEGIGEILTPLSPLPECYLVIAKPDINVSTKFVYENLHADKLQEHPDIDGMKQAIADGSIKGITDRMSNVLETVTVKEYPVIEQIKNVMKKTGAVNALMSGSGPTVFGIYENKETAEASYHQVKKSGLAGQIFMTTTISETCTIL